MFFALFRSIVVSFLAVLVVGCQVTTTTSSSSAPSEEAYCSSGQSFTSSISITGTAVYQRREFISTCATGGTCYLGAAGSDIPIRRAEVRVLSGSSVVQCGETDDSGQFTISVPPSTAYTLQVNSRASNQYVNVSVLTSPRTNTFYSLQSAVPASSTNVNVGTLRASATGDLLGGAFNIYDQILKANEYLRLKVSSSTG